MEAQEKAVKLITTVFGRFCNKVPVSISQFNEFKQRKEKRQRGNKKGRRIEIHSVWIAFRKCPFLCAFLKPWSREMKYSITLDYYGE